MGAVIVLVLDPLLMNSGQHVLAVRVLSAHTASTFKDEASDGGHIGKDSYAEHYDHCGLQLGADSQLVAEEHQQRRGDDIREEGDHEHFIGKAALEIRACGA